MSQIFFDDTYIAVIPTYENAVAHKTIILNRLTFLRLGWAEGNLQAEQFWHRKGFREMGITVIEPDIKLWMDHVQNYYLASEEMTSTWDMDLFNEIKELA